MATINNVKCGKQGQFLKKGEYQFGIPRYVILSHKGKDILTTAQLADPETNLQSKLVADLWKNQIFAIGVLTNPENNGEGVSYETVEQHKYRTALGTYDMLYTIEGGSICDGLQLDDFDGRNFDQSFVDDENVLRCLVSATGIKGFTGHAFEKLPGEVGTISAKTKVKVRSALQSLKQYDQDFVLVDLGFDIGELLGKEKWTLSVVPGPADGQHDVTITGPCPDCSDGENNINDLYQTELNQAAAWVVVNEDGVACTVSSVAKVFSGTKVIAHRLSMSLIDADYVDGENVTINIAATSVMAASPINIKYVQGVETTDVATNP